MGSNTDRFHGYREAAELCEHVITTLFSPEPVGNVGIGQEGLDTPPHSPVLGKEAPPPLGEFIAYALYRTRLPISITHQALLLLNRLKTRYPSARGTATSPHRLFLSSLMLSSKISMDDTYSNKSWQVVGQGLFSLREVNQMERELFAFLGWNVVVRDEELVNWCKDVVEPYELARGIAAIDAESRPSMEDRKRRRDATTRKTTSPESSTSRSPSPASVDARHRRASDAAVALLHGPFASTSAPTPSKSSPPRTRRSRTPESRRASPYSSRPPSSCNSSSSSAASSPISGASTPGTPGTPVSAGPLTPDHVEHHLAPAWTHAYNLNLSKGTDGPQPQMSMDHWDEDSIQVATW
ncbi:hypothetical protein P7C70_g6004, partial [Phenoliferia sp. Uapishka_3]